MAGTGGEKIGEVQAGLGWLSRGANKKRPQVSAKRPAEACATGLLCQSPDRLHTSQQSKHQGENCPFVILT